MEFYGYSAAFVVSSGNHLFLFLTVCLKLLLKVFFETVNRKSDAGKQ